MPSKCGQLHKKANCSRRSDDESEIGSYSCSSNPERSPTHRLKVQTVPSDLLVMRHSERVDELFPGWIKKSSDADGEYRPYDGNMPRQLPVSRPVKEYHQDTPITRTGHVLARMIGRGIALAKLQPDVIYCSPATRCLQTATEIRNILGLNLLIRVEPGLFENTSMYPDRPPLVPSPGQREIAFPVDNKYHSIYTFEEIFAEEEDTVAYNDRLEKTLKTIAAHKDAIEDGEPLTVLVVAHASTVDMSVGLLRQSPRHTSSRQLFDIGSRIPFCSIVALSKSPDGSWFPVRNAMLPVTYGDFSNSFNWSFVVDRH